MAHSRKLRLDVQNLRVESFDPLARVAGRGTVIGHNLTQQLNCYTYYYGCPYTNTETTPCSAFSCQYATCTCDAAPTEEITCLNATCYWAGGAPYYDGQC